MDLNRVRQVRGPYPRRGTSKQLGRKMATKQLIGWMLAKQGGILIW